MDNISLLRELNKSTIKKSDLELDLENALKESGFDLPDEEIEDEMPEDLPGDEGPEDEIDSEEDFEYNGETELPIDDEELEDLVSWCEEECGDAPDEELKALLQSELMELGDFEDEEVDSIIDAVMDKLGRGGEEEDIEGEMEPEDDMDVGGEMVADEQTDDFPEEDEAY